MNTFNRLPLCPNEVDEISLKLCSILLRVSPKRITTPKLVVLVKQQATRLPQVFCGGRRAYSSHPQFKDKTVITSWCTPYEGARCINCLIGPEKLTYIYTLVYAMILKLYSLTLYYQVIDQQLTCIEIPTDRSEERKSSTRVYIFGRDDSLSTFIH
jgi:hypothetical protein